MSADTSRLSAFLSELKRRRVFRVAVVYAGVTFIVFWVAVVYAGVAFVIIQIIDGAFPTMHIPDWVGSLVVILLLLGFLVAVGVAWVSLKRRWLSKSNER